MDRKEVIENLIAYRDLEGGLAVLSCVQEAFGQMEQSNIVNLEHVALILQLLIQDIHSLRGAK